MSEKYILWPSSLKRAGWTEVEFDQTLDQIEGSSNVLPCKLFESSKFRNGNNRFWCPVHQGVYGKKREIEKFISTGIKKCDQSEDFISYIKKSEIPIFKEGEIITKNPSIFLFSENKKILITPPAVLELFLRKGKKQNIQCKNCNNFHEDIGEVFGKNEHKKHLCGFCGRDIFGKPGIGNPLIIISELLENLK